MKRETEWELRERAKLVQKALLDHKLFQERIKLRNPGLIIFTGLVGMGKGIAKSIAKASYRKSFPDCTILQMAGSATDASGIEHGVADILDIEEIKDGATCRLVVGDLLPRGFNVFAALHTETETMAKFRIRALIAMDPPANLKSAALRK